MAVIDPTFALSNRLEACFWTLIGIGFAIAAMTQRTAIRRAFLAIANQTDVAAIRELLLIQRDCLIAAVTFAIFGGSDLVEAKTGAWWRPWWLFAWKAACVLVFIILLARYMHRRKGARRQSRCSASGDPESSQSS